MNPYDACSRSYLILYNTAIWLGQKFIHIWRLYHTNHEGIEVL